MGKIDEGKKKRICVTQDTEQRQELDKHQNRLRIEHHSQMLSVAVDFYLEHNKHLIEN